MGDRQVAGIDVAKKELAVKVLPSGATGAFANTPEGIRELVAWLLRHEVVHVVLEATGGLELDAALALAQARIAPSIVNPRQARRFAEAMGRLEKSDGIDSDVLANFALRMTPPPSRLPDEQERLLIALVTRRRQMTDLMVCESNRLGSCREGKIRTQIEKTIAFLRRQIKALDKDIDKQVRSSPMWKEDLELLESIPGVGRITASTLIAELPEMKTLEERPLAKLVGVAPLHNESGTSQGKRTIYGGRSSVRAKLYMAALVATRHNPVIRTYYARLLGKGKEKKVALVACMHKLLDIVRAIMRSRKPWREVTPASV